MITFLNFNFCTEIFTNHWSTIKWVVENFKSYNHHYNLRIRIFSLWEKVPKCLFAVTGPHVMNLLILRVPWTARRSNQSIPMEINQEYSLEGLVLKLKLQYSGYLMKRVNSLKKTLMLGKIEGRRRSGWQRMRWLDSITDSVGRSLSKVWEITKESLACCIPWGGKESDMVSDWTTTY